MLRHLTSALSLAATVAAMWPVPKSLTQGNNTVWLASTVSITHNGEPVRWNPNPGTSSSPFAIANIKSWFAGQMQYQFNYVPVGPKFTSRDVILGGISRAMDQIFGDDFVPWRLYPRSEQDSFEPDVFQDKTWLSTLTITTTGADTPETFKGPAGAVDESYNLTLTQTGEATIDAISAVGVLHALQSFTQLFYSHSGGPFWYTPYAPVSIQDAPEYPHRGLMLDVSRHWYPVEDIYRTIDGLAWNKMNRLHIHATDSQSWPLDIPSLPDVARKGAYHPSLIYSAEDQRQIHEYGTSRGVQVIIEIDMPGHIGILGEAYPELVVAYDERPYYWYCAQPPCGGLRLNNSGVEEFLGNLFEDILPRVEPYSSYFHTGGDEVNANASTLDPGVGTSDVTVLQPLIQDFTDNQHKRIVDAGLIPIVWEEMSLEWNVTLKPGVVVQSWLGSVSELTARGHQVIDSNYNFLVRLDHVQLGLFQLVRMKAD